MRVCMRVVWMRVVCKRVVYFGRSLIAYVIDGCISMTVSRHIMHLCESPVSRHFGDSCRQLIASSADDKITNERWVIGGYIAKPTIAYFHFTWSG